MAEGVRARGGSQEQIAAAWLHDAVEDDALSEEWLREAPLSRRTKDIVLALTKRQGEPPEAYTARILATPGALLVKESDLAHNADPARLSSTDPLDETICAPALARRSDAELRDSHATVGQPTAGGRSARERDAARPAPRANSAASRLNAHSIFGSMAKRNTRWTGGVHSSGHDRRPRRPRRRRARAGCVQPVVASYQPQKREPLTRKPCSR